MSFKKLNLSAKDIIVNTDMICYIEEKKKEYIVYFANNFCTLYISKEDAMPLLRAINMEKEI